MFVTSVPFHVLSHAFCIVALLETLLQFLSIVVTMMSRLTYGYLVLVVCFHVVCRATRPSVQATRPHHLQIFFRIAVGMTFPVMLYFLCSF